MSSRFNFIPTVLSGVWIAEREMFEDNRGALGRIFCAEEFSKIGLEKPIVQVNYSLTRTKGNVRGLHFQYPPHTETKIVSCLKGKILDVAVDLRHGSKTFLLWHGEILSSENRRSMFIPEGFAHGFQALTDNCEMVYFHSGFYVPESESGINVEDKRIAIDWPLPVSGLSERDRNLIFLTDDFQGIVL